MKNKQRKKTPVWVWIICGLMFLFLTSMLLGRYPINLGDILMRRERPMYVLWNVRLPRILTAMVVGGGLSVAGAAFQGMFKNPMVSPDILGASSGAALGASIAIMMSWNILGVQVLAFIFGLIAVTLTYAIGMKVGRDGSASLVLILAGILVGTLARSLVSLVKYMADPYDKLPSITYWLMGSLASVNIQDFIMLISIVAIGVVPLFLYRWKINLLCFHDEEAETMGVDTKRLRAIMILSATLITSSIVAVSGLIGWVGLIVPHFARMLVGPNFKRLLPASLLLGSGYLLVVDNLARTMSAVEIPLAILTSVVGAPFFIYLLMNTRKGWI